MKIKFCIDPGTNFDWSTNYKSKLLPCDELLLQEQFDILRYHLDVVLVQFDDPISIEDYITIKSECKILQSMSQSRRKDSNPSKADYKTTSAIPCTQLSTRCHENQEDMITNYLQSGLLRSALHSFEAITENEYKFRKPKKKEAANNVCDCVREGDEMGCGNDCSNRSMQIECGPQCVFGDRCLNRRFQKQEYSTCKIFETYRKGYGLVASTFIPANQFIIEYVGEVLNKYQFEKRSKDYSGYMTHDYFMALENDFVIDSTKKGNISRFINHSCDPNAEAVKWKVNGEVKVGIFSIMHEEEITYDYNMELNG